MSLKCVTAPLASEAISTSACFTGRDGGQESCAARAIHTRSHDNARAASGLRRHPSGRERAQRAPAPLEEPGGAAGAPRHRVPFEALVAWYARELALSEAHALEEHLFSCGECAAASQDLGRLIGGLRGMIPPVISHALRDKLAAAGQRILFTPCAPEGTATARFAPDIDVMVHALSGDLSKAERVDVEIVQPDGAVRLSFEHVPFDPKVGEVLVACQRHYRTMMADGEQPTFRVHVTEAGERRRLADYLVIHIWD